MYVHVLVQAGFSSEVNFSQRPSAFLFTGNDFSLPISLDNQAISYQRRSGPILPAGLQSSMQRDAVVVQTQFPHQPLHGQPPPSAVRLMLASQNRGPRTNSAVVAVSGSRLVTEGTSAPSDSDQNSAAQPSSRSASRDMRVAQEDHASSSRASGSGPATSARDRQAASEGQNNYRLPPPLPSPRPARQKGRSEFPSASGNKLLFLLSVYITNSVA